MRSISTVRPSIPTHAYTQIAQTLMPFLFSWYDFIKIRNHNLFGKSCVASALAEYPSYNGMLHIYSKTAHSSSTVSTPSNTPIPRQTPLTAPNGIQIQSAVLPQHTLRTDRPTDRWDWRQVCTNTRLRSIDCIATRIKTGKPSLELATSTAGSAYVL